MFQIKNTQISEGDQFDLYNMALDEPYRFFLPNRPQADMIKAVGTMVPGKRIFLVTSGNGTGKTTCVINIIANIVYGPINAFHNIEDRQTGEKIAGFFDYPLYERFPERWPRRIWYVSNKDAIKSIWEEFQVWIPSHLYRSSKGGKTYVSDIWFHGTNWMMSFKTVDQDEQTYESANISIIIFDEPPPLKLYRAAIARLRSGGIIIIPATPLFGASWFVDEIIEQIGKDSEKYHQTVTVWENCIERAGEWDLGKFGIHPKGCLFEDNIRLMIKNWDPDEREARENGKFQHLSGMVYKTYIRDAPAGKPCHFVDIKKAQQPELYVYQFVVDPHDRRPPVVIWIRIDQYGRKRVIREWPSPEDSCYHHRPYHKINSSDPYILKDFVRMWCDIEIELGIPKNRVQAIIDPNFGRKPNHVTGKLLFQDYQDEFEKAKRPRAFVTNAVDDLATGHKAVKDLLKPTPSGDLYLQIDRSCYNTDYSFRRYSYLEWQGKSGEGKDISVRVKDEHKHHVDCVRYAAMVDFDWWPLDQMTESMKDDYGFGADHVRELGKRPDNARAV